MSYSTWSSTFRNGIFFVVIVLSGTIHLNTLITHQVWKEIQRHGTDSIIFLTTATTEIAADVDDVEDVDDDDDDNDISQTYRKNNNRIPTLRELIQMADTNVSTECPDHLIYVPDVWYDDDDDDSSAVARYIHMTTKSRCMTKAVVDNLSKWQQFAKEFHYSIIIHTDIAMEALIRYYAQYYDTTTKLIDILHCAITPTMVADIWRGIVLYLYGGIYTDLDNAPGTQFVQPYHQADDTTSTHSSDSSSLLLLSLDQSLVCAIRKTDDAFFVVEKDALLSQYFMVTNRRHHPLMQLLIERCIERTYQEKDIYRQFIPTVTGPKALKEAFRYYMNYSYDIQMAENKNDPQIPYDSVVEGYYVSPLYPNRSVTVRGHKDRADDIIHRDSYGKKKKRYLWRQMNMTYYHNYFHSIEQTNITPLSCAAKIAIMKQQQQ